MADRGLENGNGVDKGEKVFLGIACLYLGKQPERPDDEPSGPLSLDGKCG